MRRSRDFPFWSSPVEVPAIVFHANFVLGAALIDDDLGQVPLGDDAVVFDVDRFRGHGKLRQNPSARVDTSIRVGVREPSAAVSAGGRMFAVAARKPSTP
jgi:hypothetical protein